MTLKKKFNPKNIPLYSPQRYTTLYTFKKENKKTMEQATNLIPKKSILK
jgi:hypothetical protein